MLAPLSTTNLHPMGVLTSNSKSPKARRRQNELVRRTKKRRGKHHVRPVKGGTGRQAGSRKEWFNKHAAPIHPGTGTDQSAHGGGPDRERREPSLLEAVGQQRKALATAAQEIYDSWEQDETGFCDIRGTGGICDEVNDAIVDTLNLQEDDEVVMGGQPGDDHAWSIVGRRSTKQAVGIDIAPWIYEEGGGFSWKKIDGITIEAKDVSVFDLSDDFDLIFGEEDIRKHNAPIHPGTGTDQSVHNEGGSGQQGELPEGFQFPPGMSQEASSERQQGVLDTYNVTLTTADGQNVQTFTSVGGEDERVRVAGAIFVDGEEAGRFTRLVRPDRVSNDTLFLTNEFQGSGIGTQLVDAWEQNLPEIGVSIAEINAVDLGRYVWAVHGYSFTEGAKDEVFSRLNEILEQGDDGIGTGGSLRGRFGQDAWEEMRSIVEAFNDGDVAWEPIDIASIGSTSRIEGTHLGKELLLSGSSWDGFKEI